MVTRKKENPPSDVILARDFMNPEHIARMVRRGPLEMVPREELRRLEHYREVAKELFNKLKISNKKEELAKTEAQIARLDKELAEEESIASRYLLEEMKGIKEQLKEAKEGTSGATHHQKAETGEADRGSERGEPADTFKVVLNNYAHIKYNGKSVHLNPSAAQILKYMSEDCREQDVTPKEARIALVLQPESWRDLFRHTGLWDTLIVKGNTSRTRRLSVYP